MQTLVDLFDVVTTISVLIFPTPFFSVLRVATNACCPRRSGALDVAMSRGDHPPLAPFEELVHTNADLSHLVLDGLQSIATAPTRPPRELKLVRVEARRPAGRLDPDPEDGLVRVEVLALGAREVGGLGMHELKAELVELPKPPHVVAVFTDAPEDAAPERWEAALPELADTKTVRVEWTPSGGGSVVVAVALVC